MPYKVRSSTKSGRLVALYSMCFLFDAMWMCRLKCLLVLSLWVAALQHRHWVSGGRLSSCQQDLLVHHSLIPLSGWTIFP